jgi:site-specific recombinase XerD
VAILSLTEDHSYCRAPTGRAELHSRPGKSRVHGHERLEATTDNLSIDKSVAGTSKHRSVCEQAEHATGSVPELETRSTGESSGRLQSDVEPGHRLCVPPLQFDQQVPNEGAEGGNRNHPSNANMANTTMVPEGSADVGRGTDITAATPKIADVTTGGTPPTGGNGRIKTSGLESLRERTSARGLSDRATEVCLQARRPGTQLAYNGPWDKWSSWCSGKQINPVQATVADIADFLTEMFDTGLEYSTMNSYRSAISAYHPEVENYPVGKHPVIKTLLQGMFNERPPKPRYGDTWDVDLVLRHMKSKGDNENLGLKDLTLKVTMLLALSSAGRGSELHQLNPKMMMDRGDSLEFHIEGLTKTKRPSKPHATVKIHEFAQERKLDVVETVRKYLARTNTLRVGAKQKSQLLISFVKPHQAIHKCTIARWLKMTMQGSGIDTSVYKAHSTRMASVSKARAQGVSAEQIMLQANWSQAATFHRFYHRDNTGSGTNEYQNTILTLE